ncbi:hypothetical protein NicSoilB8_13890 [Arthrobacter sp. NicSoilB8]|nr:hypothetical protein NicSoilB8_13890 [Arthrobacter sp. NicSoilB8]
MIPKRKAVTDVPARLAVFEPADWGTVFEWARARRTHFEPLRRTASARWMELTAESHRVISAVLLRGELS